MSCLLRLLAESVELWYVKISCQGEVAASWHVAEIRGKFFDGLSHETQTIIVRYSLEPHSRSSAGNPV